MLLFENFGVEVNGHKLLQSLSVAILPGSITYINGTNGAGKTTILRSLAGLRKIQHGNIKLYGLELYDFYKPYCLYIGHKLGINEEMTVIDQIEFWARSYHSPEMIEAAIQFWDLREVLDKKISSLSSGWQKKVSLSRLTCCHSELWLLDEVESNLDQNGLKFLEFAITAKANSGGIIIVTSHNPHKIKNSQTLYLKDYL